VSLIPDEVIEQVREAADLVGIVGEHVELKRTGADWRGPCPFHGGTHRNLAVIPKKGMFYCFVCHEGGDVFTFLMKRLGMDYPTAVREVARRAGIVIPEREQRAGPDPREPLFGAVAAAHEWFVRQLWEGDAAAAARRHLEARGIDRETAGVLALGYAPPGRVFLEAMQALGLAVPLLLEAGLVARREDGTVVPRFRGRLLFPIHDLRGRVVAFGGRVVGEGEPKYLNSPDTPVFHKGQLLYNLHAAKHAIRKAERAVLVEGYFDVVAVSRAGVEEVVAPLGTGLTGEQAALLRRYTAHAVLLYDSDDAGLRATFRAGDALLRHGLRVSVATLPEGDDPDTLVRARGARGLEETLREAVDVLDRKILILERRGLFGTLPGRRRALDRLLPTIRAAQDPITRELYLSRVAEAAQVRKDVLEREAGSGERGAGGREQRAGSASPAPGSLLPAPVAPAGAEKALVLLLLAGEPWRARVLDAVDAEDFEHPLYRAVYEAEAEDAPHRLDEQAARLFELLRGEGLGGRAPDALFARALDWIEARRLERELEKLDREIPLASADAQPELLAEKRRVFDALRVKFPRYKIAARRRSVPGA
jgi:DNA primase